MVDSSQMVGGSELYLRMNDLLITIGIFQSPSKMLRHDILLSVKIVCDFPDSQLTVFNDNKLLTCITNLH